MAALFLPAVPACPQAARSTDMNDYRLFPCLRATADLLMMPKEVGVWRTEKELVCVAAGGGLAGSLN